MYVGTDGLHQDEFLRGGHPKTLFKRSIAIASLEAAIINSKYVSSIPIDRISRDSDANGLHLSKQIMSNWTVWSAESKTLLPKGKAADGFHYSVNQEEYLKLFLTDGEIPIDASASERALRNFTLGRKNWITINTVRGVQASAIIYSITEAARANKLNVYYYIKYLLTELPK